MATISLRVSPDDDQLIRKYAKIHNKDLSAFIREAVIAKIEDEYDLALIRKVIADEQGQETYSMQDVKKELGL